jgi:hypothetical protein
MAVKRDFAIADTSPEAASTAVGTILRGLSAFDFFVIDAALVGATGGALDVYLQREVGIPGSGTTVWRDWLHFTQLASGAAAIKYCLSSGVGSSTGITTVGEGTTPVLAANAFIGGHPGDAVRALYVAGASTSAGAAIAINITAWAK